MCQFFIFYLVISSIKTDFLTLIKLEKIINKINDYKKYTYAKLKNMVLSFENCIIPILDYMKDGDTYLLKELWRFCKKDETSMIDNLICKDENAYFKAELSVDFLLQNELIKEVEYKQYKITSEGKKLLKHMCRYDINKIDIPIISKYLPEFKYFGLEYKEGYPTSIEEIKDKAKGLKEEIYNELEETEKIKELEKIEETEVNPIEQYKKLKEITEIAETKQKRKQKEKSKSERNKKPRKIDFEKINREKADLGKFCEHMVYLKEKERIINEGREDLLSDIIWVSEKEGDGTGYDIKSIKKIGNDYEPIYIEVKGSNKNELDHFYVTINELKASWEYKDKYYICQVINAKKDNPQFKYTQGEIDKNFKLDAIQYEANSKE